MRKSPDTFAAFIRAIEGGASIAGASRACSITEQCVRRWLKDSRLSREGYIVSYRNELQPFHVAVATAKRRAEPTPDDWLDLPSDHPPTPADNLQCQQAQAPNFSTGLEVEVETVESKLSNEIGRTIAPAIPAKRMGDHPRAFPPKLSPLPPGQVDLSRPLAERPDLVELRRLAALPPKNPRPTAAVPIGKPSDEPAPIPEAARATPTPERVIRSAGQYISRDTAAEGLGSGPLRPRVGAFKVV